MGGESTGMGTKQLEFVEPDNQPMFFDKEEHGSDEVNDAARKQATSNAENEEEETAEPTNEE